MSEQTVTVYQADKWDHLNGEIVRLPRAGTLDAIRAARATPVMASAREIDSAALDGNGFEQKAERPDLP
jgi:hypothetical protein